MLGRDVLSMLQAQHARAPAATISAAATATVGQGQGQPGQGGGGDGDGDGDSDGGDDGGVPLFTPDMFTPVAMIEAHVAAARRVR